MSPGPDGLRVRELRWGDFDDLRETYYRLYEERDRGDPLGLTLFETRPSLADESEWFGGLFRRALAGDAIVSVAEIDRHVVGHCTIGRLAPSAASESAHVGVLGIVVDERYRGRGVGTALIEDALRRARAKFEVVRLQVFAFNSDARRLYERMGFVGCGRIPRVLRRGGAYFDSDEMVLVFGSEPDARAKS